MMMMNYSSIDIALDPVDVGRDSRVEAGQQWSCATNSGANYSHHNILSVDSTKQRAAGVAMAGVLAAGFEACTNYPVVDAHLSAGLSEPILANLIVDYSQFDLLQLITEVLALFAELSPTDNDRIVAGKVAGLSVGKADRPNELAPEDLMLESQQCNVGIVCVCRRLGLRGGQVIVTAKVVMHHNLVHQIVALQVTS